MNRSAKRFWLKTDRSGACWLWIARSRKAGYGAFFVDGRMQRAHRVAWQIVRGPIPPGLDVLHRCDVRACVNPNHLFLGTNADNVADKVAKGRQVRGEAMPMAKLTAADVAVIKSRVGRGAVQAQIAREYGVSSTTVNGIALGRDWKHVAPAHAAPLLRTG